MLLYYTTIFGAFPEWLLWFFLGLEGSSLLQQASQVWSGIPQGIGKTLLVLFYENKQNVKSRIKWDYCFFGGLHDN